MQTNTSTEAKELIKEYDAISAALIDKICVELGNLLVAKRELDLPILSIQSETINIRSIMFILLLSYTKSSLKHLTLDEQNQLIKQLNSKLGKNYALLEENYALLEESDALLEENNKLEEGNKKISYKNNTIKNESLAIHSVLDEITAIKLSEQQQKTNKTNTKVDCKDSAESKDNLIKSLGYALKHTNTKHSKAINAMTSLIKKVNFENSAGSRDNLFESLGYAVQKSCKIDFEAELSGQYPGFLIFITYILEEMFSSLEGCLTSYGEKASPLFTKIELKSLYLTGKLDTLNDLCKIYRSQQHKSVYSDDSLSSLVDTLKQIKDKVDYLVIFPRKTRDEFKDRLVQSIELLTKEENISNNPNQCEQFSPASVLPNAKTRVRHPAGNIPSQTARPSYSLSENNVEKIDGDSHHLALN